MPMGFRPLSKFELQFLGTTAGDKLNLAIALYALANGKWRTGFELTD